ncbi:Leucine-rich repeat - like 10 [Theobroma cacao]|nr:Leucine-rich repeat - like 10 [Theobroma cacao]
MKMSVHMNYELRRNRQVPSQVSHLSKLVSLDLSGNYIQTLDKHTLKGLIENLTKVRQLVLDDINMSSISSNALMNLSSSLRTLSLEFQYNSLEEISFGNNKLKGPIPSSISHLVNLTFVDLSNLIGIVEVDMFSKLQNLQVLDLSYNSLSLSSNGVSANYTLPNLQGLYLSSCNVSEFPQFLRGSESLKRQEMELEKIFSGFTSIDLSNNEFQGEIPKVIGKLDSLKELNLSHNNLSSCIPTTMGNLTALESLDLSSNKLVGKIPEQLTSLGSLEVLNLSQNQLVGPIPKGKQFNTFGNDSYAGNLGLCGFPLSKSCDNTEAPIFPEEADSEFGFEWKAALMGYGSGLVFGISAAYIMFTLGKPRWLVRMVEEVGYKLKRYLKGRKNLGCPVFGLGTSRIETGKEKT